MPDGALSNGSWSGRFAADDHVAFVATCVCGWRGATEHPPTNAGQDAAVREWRNVHLQELIEEASRGWPVWAERVAERARQVAELVVDGELWPAARLADELSKNVYAWCTTAEHLAADRGGEPR